MKRRMLTCSLLLCLLLLAGCGKEKAKDPTGVPGDTAHQMEETLAAEGSALLMPWEAEGAKQPEEYTLEEYEGLTADQRKAFLNYLGAEGYAQWLEKAEAEAEQVEIPWEEAGAKQPKDYTLADYYTLTQGQQKAFMEALGPQGLEAWLNKVQGGSGSQSGTGSQSGNQNQSGTGSQGTIVIPGGNNIHGAKDFYPWEKAGAKKAEDYSLGDYVELSLAEQKAFRDHLGKKFEAWFEKALEEEYPWLAAGAKQPADYSWEEYLALKENQRVEFQKKLGADGFAQWQKEALNQELNNPWKKPGAKQPADYTWAEYEKLTEAQQAAFQEHLGEEGMKAWLRTLTQIPWEQPGGKKPGDYTLKEYESLKAPQQLAFRIYLGFAEFEAWLTEAKNPAEANPWEKPGAKQPKDYTLAEYNALTAAQQMAFQNHLGTKGFEDWMNKAQGKPAANPWEKPGAKQPADYTWAEFNALTQAQQMAFQNHLGDKAFEAWLNKVQPKPSGSASAANPWEKPGAKQPADYTWAEFNALTAAQQMAFQKALGAGGFEAWLNRVQEKPSATPTGNPWDAPGAKQPADYTWTEFNALTAAQQMAFQNALGASGFEAWLNRVQSQPVQKNPWDAPGAKQPASYTWAEFEALTAAQQMAFQNALGAAGFEAWLNNAQEKPLPEPTEKPTEPPVTEPPVTEPPVTEPPVTEPVAEPTTQPTTEPAEVPAEVSVEESTEVLTENP